ncbi:unnamed protein product [Dicrocoelium dendriticum]|nr:unnamed protein product [Dicrocoelium dendriticum]
MTMMATPLEEFSRSSEEIDRLALRISLADDDEQFEKVIHKSLVYMLKCLTLYEDHRKKLMELLGDVTRRLKARPTIQVPVRELFLTYNDQSNLIFLSNFSHMYLRLGYPRLPAPQQIKLLPLLFTSLTEDKPVYQRDALLHITLPFIGNVTPEAVPRDIGLSEMPLQRRFITEFYSLVLLTPYNLQRLARFDGNDSVIPDGFNSYDLSRVVHDRFSSIASAEDLEKYKLGLIQFYSRHFFPAEESIIPILFGYGDTRHSVVSTAAKELRTLSMIVDWEDEVLLSRLLTWYLGRRREFDPKGRTELRRPLSPTMRIKLGHYLLRSKITLPGLLAPSLVEAALLSLETASTTPASHAAAQPQAAPAAQASGPSVGPDGPHACDGSCANHAPQPNRHQTEENSNPPAAPQPRAVTNPTSLAQRKRLAEHGLDLLAHLINNITALNGPASMAALRCLVNFVYEKTADELTASRARGFELLSRFLTRDPNYLLKDPAQLPRLFDVLSEDNPTELKLAAANCLRRLAVTFQDAQRQNFALRNQLGKLERLLYENIEKPDPLCRLVSVNFAGLIYPSDHIPTRYLILQALGDKDQHVRKEACMAFEQFLDPNIIHDIVCGRVKLPSFVEFVNHDTQHSRKNPFVEVERLIPVVQFIRLCLLATRGALTPAQEAGLTYETEDEVRYLVNQTVRYFLSIGSNSPSQSCSSNANASTSPSASPNSSTVTTASISPEQAKRSIDTYFRLIQVVIFARSQHSKESPNFPNYLEEVLVGNTKELITCNKQLFDRINNVLLVTPRGVNCRHACASVYSVVVMETEPPAQALQTAKKMLASIPSPSSHIDGENSHAAQGMFMGAAYLLERLFSRYVAVQPNGSSASKENGTASPGISAGACTEQPTNPGNTPSKKGKKDKQQQGQQQKQLRADIISAIEHFTNLMSPFLVKPSCLSSSNDPKDKRSSDAGFYSNAAVAQATVASLLESLMIVLRAGCLSHLPEGSLPITGNPPNLAQSKAAMVHRIGSYLSLPVSPASGEVSGAPSGQLHVVLAALRALAACCMGEGIERVSDSSGKTSKDASVSVCSHPHTIAIMKLMTDTTEISDPSLHLAVGVSLADCLLGPASPLKKHWYERVYPLVVDSDAIEVAVASPAGIWLARHLDGLLSPRTGQTRTRPATLFAALWTLALVRRLGPLPTSLLPDRLIIDLLEDKDESVQCVAVATLGQIYDGSCEEDRVELVANLTKTIAGNEKRQVSPVYRELCNLAQQIGRPDLALSLIVLAIAPPPNARLLAAGGIPAVGCSLAASVTYAGLIRRLGRALAPAVPRLVPRIFVRRFDYARPKLRQAIENLWVGLATYASNSTALTVPCITSCSGLTLNGMQPQTTTQQQQQQQSGPCIPNSVHVLSSEMIEAHFNAIICEIKTQLGFNTINVGPGNLLPNVTLTSSDAAISAQCAGSKSVRNTGTQDQYLRDACCLAIANLTTHPAADKRLAGHLPALLSGLLGLCDEHSSLANGPSIHPRSEQTDTSLVTTPSEEAAIAVQKLVIRVLENPCSREAAAGLLPGLLPVIIDRAPWTLGSVTEPNSNISGDQSTQSQSESRRLALELLLAAARTARPSALRPALPQLVLAGLQTMSSVHPSLVASLMRQSIHHLYQLYSSAGYISPGTQSSGLSAPAATSTNGSYSSSVPPCMSSNREIQMAEVLRLCVRLIDDVCLSRLIVPFTELIRAGGSPSTATTGSGAPISAVRESAAVATATCVFISHLAAANISALAASNSFARNNTCLRCSSSALGLPFFPDGTEQPSGESPNLSPGHRPPPPGSVQSPPSPVASNSPSVPSPAGFLDSLSTAATSTSEVANSVGHRYRLPVSSLKHGPSSLATPSGPNGSVVNGRPSVPGPGGGFASLIPHTGKLLAALLSALPGACRHPESAGKTAQIEMARALASLLRFAKSTSVAKLFNRVRSWYINPEPATCSNDSSSVSTSHWACARVMHAVAHQCPELLFVHAGVTLPLIFLNRQPDTEGTNAIFSQLDYAATQSVVLPACDSTRDCNDPNNNATHPSATQVEIPGESASIQQLWQETWEQLMSKIPPSSCSFPALWPTSTLQLFVPSVCGLVTSFLRPPLLDHCIHLLQDALLDCSSSSVRTQAAMAILHLAARLIGQPIPTTTQSAYMPRRIKSHPSRLIKDANRETLPSTGSNRGHMQSDAATFCVPTTTTSEDLGKNSTTKQYSSSSDKDEESEIDGAGDEDNDAFVRDDDGEEWAYQAWASLIQLTARVLSKSKPWPDKACLLRATRLLAVYARERGLATEEANEEIVHQLWCSLVHETKMKPSEGISSGYRAEAFLSLASLAEASGKNLLLDSELLTVDGDEEKSSDCLLSLSRLIAPNWLKQDKCSGQSKSATINPELNDSELELAVRALGILWPAGGADEHLTRFPDTISLLNFVMLHGNCSVQAACLASVLGILAKLTPGQSKNLVEYSEKSMLCTKDALELSLKDLLSRIKRAAGNQKSQLLREHALGCIAAILRHSGFLTLIREQVIQTLQVFSNDSVASLRDCAMDLRKSF